MHHVVVGKWRRVRVAKEREGVAGVTRSFDQAVEGYVIAGVWEPQFKILWIGTETA